MATPAAVLSIIVEAQTGKAEAALKEFQRDLKKVDREKAEAVLAAEVEKGGFNVFSGMVQKADMEKADASLGVDLDQSEFAQAKAAQAVLAKESNKLSDVFNRSQLSIGQWTAALAAGLPVIIDLAGGLGALTASLGAATAGVGALAVGLGGAATVGFAGVIAVMAPAISNLKDLKTAQDAYTLAVQRYGRGSTQAATALSLLQVQQKRAGPEATRFAAGLARVTRRWKELTEAGQGDFFGALAEGIGRLNRKLPLLAASANSSMKALRGGFTVFLDKATGPGFNHFIKVMTVTFAKSVGPIAAAFGNIAVVLERLAVAVAPDIVRMAKGFREITRGWVDSTRNARDLRETVHGLVNQAHAWWQLIKAAAELIVAVLVPGMGQGKKAVEGITQTLKGWTDWVKGHPREMRDFFKQGLETTKQLAQVLLSFLPQLFEISKAMRPIARAFLAITKALNSIKVGNVSALTLLLGAFVAGKALKGIVGITAAFKDLKIAALAAAAAEKLALFMPGRKAAKAAAIPLAAEGGIGAQAAQGPALVAAPKNIASLARYAKVAGGAAIAITALVGAFEALRTNFLGVRDVFTGFFDKVLKPLGDAFTDLVDTLSAGHAAEIFGAIGNALGLMGPPLKFVVTNMTKLIGLLAIGAIAAPFILAMTAMAVPVWLAIKAITFLIKTIGRIGGAIKDAANFIRDKWGGLGHVLGAPFRLGWRVIRTVVGNITDKVGSAVGFIRDRWGNLKSILAFPFRTIANFVGDKIGYVVGRVKDAVGAIRDRWTDLRSILAAPFRAVRNVVRAVVGFIVDKVNFVVDKIKWLIGKIDTLKDKIPSIPSPGSIVDKAKDLLPHTGGLITPTGRLQRVGFARGGPVGSDTVPAMLTPGEFVVRKQAVEKVGTRHLAALNAGKSAEPVEVKLSLEAGATKALVDDTRKAAKETSKALATELGKGHKTAGASTKEFVKGEGKQFKVLRSDTESTTTKLKRDVIERFQDFRKGGLKATDSLKKGSGKDFGATQKDAVQRTQRLKQNVTDDFNKTRSNTLQATGKMKQGVGADYHNMAAAAGDGIQKLGAMTNRALKALGVKTINFGVSTAKSGKGKGKQHGGMVVPGTGSGDKVPLTAMVEPGEKVFVLNRNASKMQDRLERLNTSVPRFQRGGTLGELRLQGGGYAGMHPEIVSLVKGMISRFGGSLFSGLRPGDDGFHGRGLAGDWVGGDWAAASRYVNSIGSSLLEGIYNPGSHGGTPVSWDSGKKVPSSFWGAATWAQHLTHIHVATESMAKGAAAVAKKLKKVKITGPEGPLRDMAQAAVDKVRGAADRYIQRHQPKMSADVSIPGKLGGPVVAQMGKILLANGFDRAAAAGIIGNAYRESLWNPGAVGTGGGGLFGFTTSPVSLADLHNYARQKHTAWTNVATQMEFMLTHGNPTGLAMRGPLNAAKTPEQAATIFMTDWERPGIPALAERQSAARQAYNMKSWKKGGLITAPFVGAFKQGGKVPKDGLGLLHEGEQVVPKKVVERSREVVQRLQSGGMAGPGGPGGTASSHHDDSGRMVKLHALIKRLMKKIDSEKERKHPDKDKLEDLHKRIAKARDHLTDTRKGHKGRDHGPTTSLRPLETIKKKVGKAMSERGTVARLDETIDVAQRIAETTRSPAGSELSKGEREHLITLQKKLLDTLKKTRGISLRAVRIIKQSTENLERRIKRIDHKLDGDLKKGSKAFGHVRHLHKLINRERERKQPDRKKIGRWVKEIKRTEEKAKPGEKRAKKMKEEVARLQGKDTKFKAAGPAFQETLIDLQGLTGRSGRILDTQLAIQELKDAGKPQPLHLDELLAFAEAMRYGAFKIPAFAEGGIHKGGLALVGEKGPEVVKMPPASVHPITTTAAAPTVNVNADVRVFVGNREITDIVDTRIKVKDRKTASRYRAGQVRR